ncbi:hypothetical protein [Cellulomonas denverensis]|uniref:hypothetical protein n=1 Tax=Cellulomonas denverensis TaxID=264297 RepID=UPI0035E94EF4
MPAFAVFWARSRAVAGVLRSTRATTAGEANPAAAELSTAPAASIPGPGRQRHRGAADRGGDPGGDHQGARVPGAGQEPDRCGQAVDQGRPGGDQPGRPGVEAQLTLHVGQVEAIRQPDQAIAGGDQGGGGGDQERQRAFHFSTLG